MQSLPQTTRINSFKLSKLEKLSVFYLSSRPVGTSSANTVPSKASFRSQKTDISLLLRAIKQPKAL